MGEKGNVSGAAAAVIAAGASQSAFEKVTDTASSSVVGVGQDFLETVKDKSIGAVADNTVGVARDRMQRKEKPGPGSGDGDGGLAGGAVAPGDASPDPV